MPTIVPRNKTAAVVHANIQLVFTMLLQEKMIVAPRSSYLTEADLIYHRIKPGDVYWAEAQNLEAEAGRYGNIFCRPQSNRWKYRAARQINPGSHHRPFRGDVLPDHPSHGHSKSEMRMVRAKGCQWRPHRPIREQSSSR